jgi:hypothetical protein
MQTDPQDSASADFIFGSLRTFSSKGLLESLVVDSVLLVSVPATLHLMVASCHVANLQSV